MNKTFIPPIQLSKNWSVLEGMSYGLNQPILMGNIKIKISVNFDFSRIDKIMDTFVEESFISNTTDNRDVVALLQRLIFWQAHLQQQQKIPVFDGSYIKKVSEDIHSSFIIAIPYHHMLATRMVIYWLVSILNTIILNPLVMANDNKTSFNELLQKLRPFALVGVNRYHLVKAAYNLHIPYSKITPLVYAFGLGENIRWLNSTFTDETSAIGVGLVRDKSSTANILNSFGLPAPEHAFASNEDMAIKTANSLGYPVVVKPNDQDQGRGVYSNIKNIHALKEAFKKTSELSNKILIEKHVEGDDYRLYVLNNNVILTIKRIPGGVEGDGIKSIKELLKIKQETGKLKSHYHNTGKMLIEFDDEALNLLKENGLTVDSIPSKNELIPLRNRANISTGGTYEIIDMDNIHKDNINLAVTIASIFNLDICGVDLITKDIALSWMTSDAIVCEVNSMPQFVSRLSPKIFEYILEELVPNSGKIPVHLVIASSALELQMEEIEHLVQQYRSNGVSMQNGTYINSELVSKPFKNSFKAAKALLKHKSVTSAVLVMSHKDVITFGLPTTMLTTVEILKISQENEQAYSNIVEILKLYNIVPTFI